MKLHKRNYPKPSNCHHRAETAAGAFADVPRPEGLGIAFRVREQYVDWVDKDLNARDIPGATHLYSRARRSR